ncbi:MAG: site-specific DNA-methyltransferase [Nitrosopumilus sp.]|uniref:DNA methyltransferase n=1 Tax=Nitrosopumilus sp. TaxID=2024843 RepID=UPI00247DB01D|nr:site-specific DNA-methyltransferase [Nitrosopumilus sp.]MCV0392525.1 site-specific DNA-methyltransferase [Nitrosopumilus sp.]
MYKKSSPIVTAIRIPKNSADIGYRIFKGDCEKWFEKLDKICRNKAKLIYLDPPYNTKRNRGARSYFSDNNDCWTEFMQNVLKKSHSYLKKSGFLVISINQMEMFNLKNIAEEIFPHGFVGVFPVKTRHHERQLMINATFHNVYEYLLIFRKSKSTRFYSSHAPYDLKEFCYDIRILNDSPIKKQIGGKTVEIYKNNQYKITKLQPSKTRFRKYMISGKIATANWSGAIYEKYIKNLGANLLVKVHGLDKKGLGYRWFITPFSTNKRGLYFQHTSSAGRPLLFTNFLDYTDIITKIYSEGGPGCDFKDSKKPEELIGKLLEVTTKKHDLVLDFFGGSGTTLVSCIKHGRSCITIEKNNEALKTMYTRLKNMHKGKDLDGKKYKFIVKRHKL